MATPQGADAFRSHWLALPIGRLADNDPTRSPITIELRTTDQPMIVETVDDRVRARPGTVEDPDAVLEGPPEVVVALLRGQLDLTEAKRRGLRFQGCMSALDRIRSREVSDH